jgi:peptide/nickel transport system substrate-binding protein
MNRVMKAIGVAVAVSLALAACSGGQVKGASAGNDTFVVAPTLAVVTDLDPSISYSNESIALQNVYESLTRYNSETKRAEPLLATSWTVSPDGLTWAFTLRDGVKFHSGRAMDATAVVESVDRNRAAGVGASYIWDAVSTVAATDASTVTFTLSYPAPLDLIASSVYSSYILDVRAAGSGDLTQWFNAGNDAGTGPYTIAKWAKGAEVEMKLASFKDYWGGWSGDHFKNVDFRVTPDANTAWQLLQNGEVDYAAFLTPQLFAKAKTTSTVQTAQGSTFQNLLSLFNTAAGPTQDVNVRKALQLAIDYKGLVSSLDSAGQNASGVVPAGLLGYTPDMQATTDLKEAAALLKTAGYGPGGKKLELTMTYAQGDDAQAKFATLLVSAVQQLGGTLTATPMDWNAQWDLGKSPDASHRQDIFVMYWYPDYADAYSWFYNVFHSQAEISFNLSYLSDPELDAAIDELPKLTATDPKEAATAYAALQKTILNDEALVAVPYVQSAQRVLSKRVGDFVDDPAYAGVVHVYDTKVVR